MQQIPGIFKIAYDVCIRLILKKPELWLTSPNCEHNYNNIRDLSDVPWSEGQLNHPTNVRWRRSKGGNLYTQYINFRLETKPLLWHLSSKA